VQFVIGRGQACSDSYHTRRSSETTRTDANPVRIREVSRGLGTSKATTYIEHRKFREDCTKFFVERVLREFDLAHIKVTDTTNLEVFVDDLLVRAKIMLIQRRRLATHSRCLALCLGQHDVQEICRSGHWRDGLQTARRHLEYSMQPMKTKKSVLSSEIEIRLDSHGRYTGDTFLQKMRKIQSNRRWNE
jgi:hypothetical protein